MSDSIEIISWNVNGIRAVANKEALKWIDERQSDILCLQEIKSLEEQIPNNLFEKEYLERHVNPAQKRGYSGTATYTTLATDFVSTTDHVDTLSE